MKLLIKILYLLVLPVLVRAQNPIYNTPPRHQVDSMLLRLKQAPDDTLRMFMYAELSPYYFDRNIDSSIYYGKQSLIIAKKLGMKLWEAFIDNSIGYSSYQKGNYISALKILLEAEKISADESSEQNIWHIAAFYDTPDPHKARMNVLAYSLLNLAFVYTIPGNISQQQANY